MIRRWKSVNFTGGLIVVNRTPRIKENTDGDLKLVPLCPCIDENGETLYEPLSSGNIMDHDRPIYQDDRPSKVAAIVGRSQSFAGAPTTHVVNPNFSPPPGILYHPGLPNGLSGSPMSQPMSPMSRPVMPMSPMSRPVMPITRSITPTIRSEPPTLTGQNLRRAPRQYNKPSKPKSKSLSLPSFRKTNKVLAKVPKMPCPQRAEVMFHHLLRAIREFIDITQDDIDQLRMTTDYSQTQPSSQAKSREVSKQVKAAERYLKRLEFHIAKIEDLHDCYNTHIHLRDGARNMQRAYRSSPGRQKRVSLNNVNISYKECTQTMCAIEAQLEAMLGTFHCQIKEIKGFARMRLGDVYEIGFRYGIQKWKTKCRVEKDSSQSWDNTEFSFNCLLGELISIKALEIKSFKSVMLGNKNCETKDLFSANPQLMTVSITSNATIKLSLIITWNPLEGVDELDRFFQVPSEMEGLPRMRPISMMSLDSKYSPMGTPTSLNDKRLSAPIHFPNQMNSFLGNSSSSIATTDTAINNSPLSRLRNGINNRQSPISITSSEFQSSPVLLSATPLTPDNNNHLFLESPLLKSALRNGNVHPVSEDNILSSMSSSWHDYEKESPLQHSTFEEAIINSLNYVILEDAVRDLSTVLLDFQGRYPELQPLEEATARLQRMIRNNCGSSRSSSVSISIESALGAFDFLNREEITTAEEMTQQHNNNNKKDSRKSSSCIDHLLASPDSTAKTADSGIESLAKRLSETQLASSPSSSPEPASSGIDHVDQALVVHLTYCTTLLENLGSYGPLRCRDIYMLDKLQKQGNILEQLMAIARAGSTVDIQQVLADYCHNTSVRDLWLQCITDQPMIVEHERLIFLLDQRFATSIKEQYSVSSHKVLQEVIVRLMDVCVQDWAWSQGENTVVTLPHFLRFFDEQRGLNIVMDIAGEVWMSDRLLSDKRDRAIKVILSLHGSLPPARPLKLIGQLLTSEELKTRDIAIDYLSDIHRSTENRDRALVVFVEALEDKDDMIRCGACAALAVLKATESIKQLVYVCQNDNAILVKARAKDTLYMLGEEGARAYEETQLALHGFQGIQVKFRSDIHF